MSVLSRSLERRKERVCRSKEVYETEEQCADIGAKAWVHNRIYLIPYRCDVCGKLHMTSKGAKKQIVMVIAAASLVAHVRAQIEEKPE